MIRTKNLLIYAVTIFISLSYGDLFWFWISKSTADKNIKISPEKIYLNWHFTLNFFIKQLVPSKYLSFYKWSFNNHSSNGLWDNLYGLKQKTNMFLERKSHNAIKELCTGLFSDRYSSYSVFLNSRVKTNN